MGVDIWTYPPTQLSSHRFIYANYHYQTLDTRPGQGVQLYPSEIGRYRFTFQSSAYATNCTAAADSSLTEKTLNVTGCLPTWAKDANGNLDQFPADGTPIKVMYPANLDGPVRAGITAWNNRLAQWGLNNVQLAASSGGCAVTDPYCISIDSKILDDPTACGSFQGFPGNNGVYTNRSLVWLKNGYDNWTSDFQQWVIDHEIGHLLGLNHADSCSIGTSVMKRTSCGGDIGSNSITATDNDAMAVARTVYQGGPQKTCGW